MNSGTTVPNANPVGLAVERISNDKEPGSECLILARRCGRGPGGNGGFWAGELMGPFDRGPIGDEVMHEELFSADIVLLGRRTYDGFAAVWPQVEDTTGFAARLNSMPKYVASRSTSEATWNNTTFIGEDVISRVRTLKSEGDGDILVYGSAGLVHDLLPAGLVDAIHLMIYPVALGRGTRLLPDGWSSRLKLDSITELGTGILSVRYRLSAG